MKKTIAAFCALSLLILILASCGGGATPPEQLIAGRWESDGPARLQVLEFSPYSDDPLCGQVQLSMMGNEISGEYEIAPGEERQRLTITYTLTLLPATRIFDFTIEDDALVLQEEKAPASVTYRRAAAE